MTPLVSYNKDKFKELCLDDFKEFITIITSKEGEFIEPNIKSFRYYPEEEAFIVEEERAWVGDRDDKGNPVEDDITYLQDQWYFTINNVSSEYISSLCGHTGRGWFGEDFFLDELYKQFLKDREIITLLEYVDVKHKYYNHKTINR